MPFSARPSNQWFHHDLDNFLHVVAIQAMEDHLFINTVDKLRSISFFNSSKMRFSIFSWSKRMSLAPKPTVLSSRRAVAPRFDVMMIMVFEKSTLRPLLSVKTPSSRTCKRTLKMSGWAFSTSSKSKTEYGFIANLLGQLPPSSYPT